MATKSRAVRRCLADWTLIGLLLLLGTTTLVQAFVVSTPSRNTTMQVGSHLLVDKLVHAPANSFLSALLSHAAVKRDDVIVFQYPLDEAQPDMKRMIDVPGAGIRFADHQLILNERAVDEPYKRQNLALRVPSQRNFPNGAPFLGIENRAMAMIHAHVRRRSAGALAAAECGPLLGSCQRHGPPFFYEDSLGANVSTNYFAPTRIAHGKD